MIDIDHGRIRFAHPLFGSAIFSEASSEQRRDLHRRLAEIATDAEERARHLALAVDGPDEEAAEALDDAARRADARGAPDSAAELSEMALRITPPDRTDAIWQRTMDAATRHFAAGNTVRARTMLEEAVETAPSAEGRAEALRRLGEVTYHQASWPEAAVLFERALDEAGADPALRASIEQRLGYAGLFTGDLENAASHARSALELAERAGHPAPVAEALQFVVYLEFVLGRGVQAEPLERAIALEEQTEEYWDRNVRPTFVKAQLLKYCDQFEPARAMFSGLLRRAGERGLENTVSQILYHLAELECWAGDWDTAERHARASLEAAVQTGLGFYRTMALFATSLVDAHRGRVDAARAAANEGLELAESVGVVTSQIQSMSVLGFVELFMGNPARAHGHLGRAAELSAAMGVEEPAVFRIMPDEVEALVALGDLDRARALLDPFEEDARRLDRAWALTTGARCRGLLLSASGDTDGALEAMEHALAFHERVPEPFALARTLFSQGRVQSRAKLKREARESFEQSLEIFRRLGADLWAERAGREARRVGARGPDRFALTATEERVASLVVQGNTNQQVADALFMSVNTVEWNLSKIYRKLGVRSRTELAARLGQPSD